MHITSVISLSYQLLLVMLLKYCTILLSLQHACIGIFVILILALSAIKCWQFDSATAKTIN